MHEVAVCCVIGTPIEYSLSPAIHTAGYRACGISDTYCFTRYQVESERLTEFMNAFRLLNFRGISVTLPHKQAVIPLLDEVDESVESLKAVNTIVNESGRLKGYNTDWAGIVEPLGQRCALMGKTALVIGAGGAARAAIYGLRLEGSLVSITNRTTKKAEELCEEFSLQAAYSLETVDFSSFDIIVQTTSVGMYPEVEESIVPSEQLRPSQIIFDIVYRPRQTRLIRDALQVGARTVSGVEMFMEQGARQFQLYTGQPAPVAAMRAALEEMLNEE